MMKLTADEIDHAVDIAMLSLHYGAAPEMIVVRYSNHFSSQRLGRWVVTAAQILLEKKCNTDNKSVTL